MSFFRIPFAFMLNFPFFSPTAPYIITHKNKEIHDSSDRDYHVAMMLANIAQSAGAPGQTNCHAYEVLSVTSIRAHEY